MQNEYEFNRRAIRPIQCLSDGYVLASRNYGGFLGVIIVAGLIILAGTCLPLTPLFPPMVCGIYLCYFASLRCEAFTTSTLFQGFNFFGQSFLASLFVTIPLVVLSIFLQLGAEVYVSYLETLEIPQKQSPEMVRNILFTGIGLFLGIILLFILVSIILGLLMTFVYPLIVDRKLNAFRAFKLSIRAVMGNFFGVIGLMILGNLILTAGVLLFYVGVLFVAPFVFAAWAVAYQRVFFTNASPQMGQLNAAQTPAGAFPVSNSRAGWVLTLGSLLIVGLAIIGLTTAGIYAYYSISNAIEKKAEEIRQKEDSGNIQLEHPMPAPNDRKLDDLDEIAPPTPPTPPRGAPKTISGGVLNHKAIDLPTPDYPDAAKAVNAKGSVTVSVVLDESGKVISAEANSGHPLLRAAAAEAAKKARFEPTKLGGKAMRVSGVIVYNFK